MSLLLKKLLLGFKTVFIVIDALDEGQGPELSDTIPWRYVLTFLFRMVAGLKSGMSIKIVATSRPNLDLEIEEFFSGGKQLAVYATSNDIGLFCDAVIPDISRCIAREPELHSRIKKAICESAKGM